MIAVAKQELKSPADKRYGYAFGCEGTVSLKDAMEALGKVSRATIDRRLEKGLLRKGKDGGRVVICAKSLRNYLHSLES